MTRIDPMQWKRATADSTFDTEKATIINVDEKLHRQLQRRVFPNTKEQFMKG